MLDSHPTVSPRGKRPRSRAASLLRAAPALAVAGCLAAPAVGEAAVTSSSFPVVADAHTTSASPNTNFGTATSMRVDSSPLATGYLRFNPQNLSGTVTKATLRLWATNSSTYGFSVRPVANTTWGERTITYNTRPAVSSTVLSSAKGYGGYRYLNLDVTPAVRASGPVSFGLVGASSTELMIGAREAGSLRGATLIVETSSDTTTTPPPPPPPSPTPDTTAPSVPANLTATGGDGSASLAWSASTDDVGVAGYRVYRNDVQIGTTTARAYTDGGLTNGTTYVYSVRAFDAGGNLSAAASVPVTPLAPAIPPVLGQTRPYDANSPWNTPIASDVGVLAKSATYINAIVNNGVPLTSDPDQYALPIYQLTGSESLRPVKCNSWRSWPNGDRNPSISLGSSSTQQVPVPAGAVQSDGSDGQIIFWNPKTGDYYELWQFRATSTGTYTCSNGRHSSTAPGNLGRFADGTGGRGAGTTYFAGTVRPWEIAQGHIDHALAFAYQWPASGVVYPASKSDGSGVSGTDAPEGTRLQLDPNLTDADFTAWGLAPEAKIIARAMQKYGMYIIDNSGSSKIYMEDRITAKWPSSITRNLTAKIPLSKFRAVAAPAAP